MTAQGDTVDKQNYFRLVAFWVICEAFAGGIIHAVKLPFSGMMVGSLAVFCIIMIGKYFPGRGNIVKATILVCIFKLMLSPHSPPTAYLAVLFQGMLGEFLFRLRLSLKVAAVVLAVLALVESAVQRILVLWLLYGTRFWDAVGKYLEKFSGSARSASMPLQLAIAYISFHALFGIFIGFYFARLASAPYQLVKQEKHPMPYTAAGMQAGGRRKKIRWLFFTLWLILFFLLAYGYAYPQKALISGKSVLWILFRAITIMMLWYFILSPLLMKWFRRKMAESKSRHMASFVAIQSLLPSTREIFYRSWKMSGEQKGFLRIHKFLQELSANMATKGSSD